MKITKNQKVENKEKNIERKEREYNKNQEEIEKSKEDINDFLKTFIEKKFKSCWKSITRSNAFF